MQRLGPSGAKNQTETENQQILMQRLESYLCGPKGPTDSIGQHSKGTLWLQACLLGQGGTADKLPCSQVEGCGRQIHI